jgi:YggT family protein
MLVLFVFAFINAVAGALTLAVFVRVILSWIPTLRLPLGIGEFVWEVTEPLLGPIRRALPLAGGIDFSPFILILAIQAAATVLVTILQRAV